MVKKSLIAAALMGFMVSAAQANEGPNGYLFGSVGQSDANTTGDNTDTAFKVGVGVQLNPYIGLEFQYTDLGEVSERGVLNGAPAEASISTDGFGANLVGTLPLDSFKLFGKVGYHQLESDAKLRIGNGSLSGSEKETVMSYGIGASFAFSPALELTAEYERFSDVADAFDIDLLTAGLRYNF